jgi:hypothetical protein
MSWADRSDRRPVHDQATIAFAAVDPEHAGGQLDDLTRGTGVKRRLDLRIVILRAAKWGERLVDRGAVRNAAARGGGVHRQAGPADGESCKRL